MERTRTNLALAKTSVAELRRKIRVAQERRDYFDKYLRELFRAYILGKTSRQSYLNAEYKKHDEKTVREWIIHYEDYIRECEALISRHNRRIVITYSIIFLVSVLTISLLTFSLYKIQPTFSGFAVKESPSVSVDEQNIQAQETVQHEAVLGQPVKWTKTISLENPGNTLTNVPREAENIAVEKIIDSYSEPAGALQNKQTSPFHEELLPSEKGFFARITGGIIRTETEQTAEKEIMIEDNATGYEISYTTPGAEIVLEESTDNGKRIKISSPENIHYENVLAFTDISEELGLKDASQVKIRWLENNTYLVPTIADKNGNGIFDRVEWTAPHLSEQTFEIIVIIKAEHLDSQKNFISDIYEEVGERDGVWSEPINNGEYVRVTFEENLTSENDITIFPRIVQGSPRIEVYEKDKKEVIAIFSSINSNEYNKIFLDDSSGFGLPEGYSQDAFDLKIISGSLEFDHIIDPIQMIFSDDFETDLAKWDGNGATAWDLTTTQEHAGAQSVTASNNNEGDIFTDDIDTSDATLVNVSFWYRDDDLDDGDIDLYFFDDAAYDAITESLESGTEDTWQFVSFTTTDTQYLKSNFRVRFNAVLGTGEQFWIDDFRVNKTTADDATPPEVTVNFPENTTYHKRLDLPFVFNVSLNEVGSARYSLDGGVSNITMNTTNNQNFNATLDDLEVGNYTFRVYANDTIGNNNHTQSITFELVQENIDVNGTVFDAGGDTINTTFVIIDESNSTTIYNETNETHETTIPLNSTYTVEVHPLEIATIESVEFTNVNFSELNNTITEIVNIDETNSTENFTIFSISPQLENFTNATVTFIAQQNSLFKCVEWNFGNQSCGSNWSLFMNNLEPGLEYNFTLESGGEGYGIIEITEAIHLDENYTYISDIFSSVNTLNDVWSEAIPVGHHVRVTFEKNLTSANDITIYPRTVSGTPTIQVYEMEGTELLATFTTLTDNQYNQILLTNLSGTQDTFDLRVLGGSVEFDHIIDPIIHFTGPSRSMDIEPLGNNTFVLAIINSSTTNITRSELSFTEYFTNGTIRRGPFHKDQTLGNVTAVSIEMINSTHIYIGWFDMHLLDELRGIYNLDGTQLLGPTTIDGANGGSSADTCLAHFGTSANRTFFGWVDQAEGDFDAVIVPDNSTTTAFVAETGIDATLLPAANFSNHIDCRTINSSSVVLFRIDGGDGDATWQTRDFAMTARLADSDVDDNVGTAAAGAVAVLGSGSNTTKRIAMAWYDGTDQDITYAINYSNNGTGVLIPTDINTTAGTGSRIDIATVSNGTGPDNFVVVWYSQDADDLMAQTFDFNGAALTSQFSIDSSTNATGLFNETAVFGKNGGTGWSICPGTWGVTYTNDTGASVFKTYFVNGSTWDGNGCPTGVAADTSNPVAQFGTNLADNHNRSNKSATFDLRGFDNSISAIAIYGNWTGSWAANQTNFSPINATYWNITIDAIPQGKWIWAAWANDTAGNAGFSTANRTFTVDTTAPNITLPFYSNGTLRENTDTLTLNVTVSDVYTTPSACKIEVNGTNTTITVSSGTCNSTSIPLTGLADGNRTINVYANDTLNNWGLNNSFVVTIDGTAPVVTLPFYANGTIKQNTETLTLNISAADATTAISACTVNINGTNQTSAPSSNWCNITNGFLTSLADGNATIFVWANDSLNNIALNSSYVVKITSNVAPAFTVIPENISLWINGSLNVDFNATDDGVIDRFFINWTNNFTINSSTGTLTNSSVVLPGSYLINVSVNDTQDAINSTLYKVTFRTTRILPTALNTSIELNTTNNSKSYGHELIWQKPYTGTFDEFGGLVTENRVAYTTAKSGGNRSINAFDALNGTLIWSTALGQSDGTPIVDGNFVYINTYNENASTNGVYKLWKSNGTIAAENHTCTGGGSPSGHVDSMAQSANLLFAGCMTGIFYAYNKDDLKVNWSTNILSTTGIVSTPLYFEDRVTFGTRNVSRPFMQLNATNGSVMWINAGWSDSDMVWDMQPSINKEGNTVYMGSANGGTGVGAFNFTTGELIWNRTDIGSFLSQMAIYDNKLWAGGNNNTLYSLYQSNGSTFCNYTTSGEIYQGPAIAEDSQGRGFVFFPSQDANAYLINATDCSLLWKYGGAAGFGPPAISEGLVYFKSDERDVYAFDFGQGGGEWNYLGHDSSGRSFSQDSLQEWQHLVANCTTNGNTTCDIKNNYNHNVGKIILNSTNHTWYYANGTAIGYNVPSVEIAPISSGSTTSILLDPNPSLGTLNVSIQLPTESTNVTQNETFLINATVNCVGAAGQWCGEVTALAGYNASSANADTAINTTQGALPLFIKEEVDIGKGTYTGFNFGVSAQQGNAYDITFNGTHFYVVGDTPAAVHEYNATGSYTGFNFSVGNQELLPNGIAFNGTHFYVVGISADTVFEYNSTGSYTGFNFSVSEVPDAGGIALNGTKFYVLSSTEYRVAAYHRNGTYSGFNFSVTEGSGGGNPVGIRVNGSNFYIEFGEGSPSVVEFTSEGLYSRNNLSLSNESSFPSGMAFYDGTVYTVTSSDNDNNVYSYNVSKFTAVNPRYVLTSNLKTSDGIYNISWRVNASGSPGNSYKVDVLFNSTTYSQNITTNNTEDRTVAITATANAAPTIPFVQAVSAQTPLELGYRSVLLNFSVNDSDGAANINISSARVQFNRTGETTRTNYTCADLGAGGTGHMFACNVSMYYYDEIGTWTINVSARDNSEAGAENSTSNFTYNLLTAMVISPATLTWPSPINLTNTNVSATNNPLLVNNTGNSMNSTINLTAYNLRGETTTTQFIFANNFTIGNVTDGCGAGINASTLSNATSKRLNGTNFSKGNNTLNHGNQTSGQEQIYFCLRGIPQDAFAQSYSSSYYGSWEIRVLLALLIPRRRKKKEEKENEDKLLGALDLIIDRIKEDSGLKNGEITEKVIERLMSRYGISKKKILELVGQGTIIPSAIFSRNLGALESLVKYMKENLKMSYIEIANSLSRNERTIWTAYKKATEKMKKPFEIKEESIVIPLSIFENKRLTILESVIIYLKSKKLKFSEIAKFLDRDQRNIWTVYSRVKKKLVDEDNNV